MPENIKNDVIKSEYKESHKFLISTFRLALALLLVVIIVIVIISIVSGSIYLYTQEKNKQLAQPKYWDEITIKSLGDASVNLKTMWKSGEIYYQFYINLYSEAIKKAGKKVLLLYS